MTLVAIILAGACVFLMWKNYQLEKRWRVLRYCWQTMSDFAADRLKDENEGPASAMDSQWAEVVREHSNLMAGFGARPLSDQERYVYESALVERSIPPLSAHL